VTSGKDEQESAAQENGMPAGGPPQMPGKDEQESAAQENGMLAGEPPQMPAGDETQKETTEENATQESAAPVDAQDMDTAKDTKSESTLSDDAAQKMEKGQKEGFGKGMGSMGTDLAYVDDELDSYSAIWESAVTGNVSDSDKERVVEALKHITNQENIEEYLDVDQMLRYIAANVVILNDDSYFGSMLHNYYLYENDGKLSMVPWDYNLAFGGFAMGVNDATDLVNRAIDDVVSSGSLEERPMLAAALSSDEYYEQYHAYLQQLVEGYFESGLFETTVNQVKEMIAPYVKTDPTAFYTYEEFEAGVDTFLSFGKARFESIKAQLDGEIPASAAERTAEARRAGQGQEGRIHRCGRQPQDPDRRVCGSGRTRHPL